MDKNRKKLVLALLLTIVEYFFLLYIKYSINDLEITFSNVNIFYVGNLINLLITGSLASGIIANLFKKPEKSDYSSNLILIIAFIALIPVIVLFLVDIFEINYSKGYYYGYPVKTLFTIYLFIANKLLQIYLLFFTWNLFLRVKHKFLFSFYLSFVLTFVLILFTFAYTQYFSNVEITIKPDKKYDVAVVFGAAVWSSNQPSPVFRGRIQKAYSLYQEEIINNIQVTGGSAPGELSEAEVAYKYLLTLGVKENDLLVEDFTSTSNEQVKYINDVLEEEYGFEDILIISDRFHLKRVLEMCRFFKIHAVGVPSEYRMDLEQALYYSVRDSLALFLFWLFAI